MSKKIADWAHREIRKTKRNMHRAIALLLALAVSGVIGWMLSFPAVFVFIAVYWLTTALLRERREFQEFHDELAPMYLECEAATDLATLDELSERLNRMLAADLDKLYKLSAINNIMGFVSAKRLNVESRELEAAVRGAGIAELVRIKARVDKMPASERTQRLDELVSTRIAEEIDKHTARDLTDAEASSACMYYRHDFGLLPDEKRRSLIATCREWNRAINKSRGKQ